MRTELSRRRSPRRHLVGARRRSSLGDKACSDSPRWVRGGVGFLLGTVLGAMTGAGIASGVVYWKASLLDPIGDIRLTRTMALVATATTVIGGGAGLLIGAHKPEC
jgi:hypothetical protein